MTMNASNLSLLSKGHATAGAHGTAAAISALFADDAGPAGASAGSFADRLAGLAAALGAIDAGRPALAPADPARPPAAADAEATPDQLAAWIADWLPGSAAAAANTATAADGAGLPATGTAPRHASPWPAPTNDPLPTDAVAPADPRLALPTAGTDPACAQGSRRAAASDPVTAPVVGATDDAAAVTDPRVLVTPDVGTELPAAADPATAEPPTPTTLTADAADPSATAQSIPAPAVPAMPSDAPVKTVRPGDDGLATRPVMRPDRSAERSTSLPASTDAAPAPADTVTTAAATGPTTPARAATEAAPPLPARTTVGDVVPTDDGDDTAVATAARSTLFADAARTEAGNADTEVDAAIDRPRAQRRTDASETAATPPLPIPSPLPTIAPPVALAPPAMPAGRGRAGAEPRNDATAAIAGPAPKGGSDTSGPAAAATSEPTGRRGRPDPAAADSSAAALLPPLPARTEPAPPATAATAEPPVADVAVPARSQAASQATGAAADQTAVTRPDSTAPTPASSFANLLQHAVGSASAPTHAPLPQAAVTPGSAPLDLRFGTSPLAADFREAVGVQVSMLARDGVQEARLHLNPAEMGPISIRIALDGSQAQVDFQVDSAATRQVLESGLPELASALREAGLTLTGGGVSDHNPGSSASSTQQGRGDAPPQHARGDGNGSNGQGHARPGRGGDLGADPQAPAPSPRRTRVATGGLDLYA